MAGTGSISISAKAVGDIKSTHQYDVTVKFDIAFNYGGWNNYGNASYTVWCDGQSQSGSASFSVSNGYGSWVWTNITTRTFRVTMPTSGQSKYISASAGIYTQVDPSYISASGGYTLPAVTWQWTVSYNANGGSGAPGSQTKTYGKTLTLSSTKPTRTGYTFKGWATSSSGSVAYSAGGSYTANSGTTLYAVWQINTYTVSYNANGGSGAPGSQTKTYGKTLTLSSTKPTRTNYNFKGWATSSTASTAQYSAGGSYTANSGATLYAVWELAYVYPSISNLAVTRCDSDGNDQNDGTKCKISFTWKTDQTISASNSMKTLTIELNGATDTITAGVGSKTGTVSNYVHSATVSTESSYTVTVKITDDHGGTTTKTISLAQAFFTLDFLAGGKGIGIGMPATKPGIYFGCRPVVAKSNGDYDITGIPDAAYSAQRTDTGTSVWMGIGSGGTNHGIYSATNNRWIIYVNANGNTYVPKTINGSMAGEWKYGRDNAVVAQRAATSDSWAPVVSVETKSGNWSIGNLNSNNHLIFSYFTDADYKAGKNTPSNIELDSMSAGIHRKIYAGRTLYSNASGSNGTITLSISAANWTYLEIYFRTNDGTSWVSSTKVYSPNGKTVHLNATMIGDDGASHIANWFKVAIVTISGTTISYNSKYQGQGWINSGNGCYSALGSQYIYITKVDGYY